MHRDPDGALASTASWLDRPVESGSAAGFGVYLHVPFCSHRCGYCDFATVAVGDPGSPDATALAARYVAALCADLGRQVAAGRAWPTVTSVFVGGGTPSLLKPVLLSTVVGAVARELDLAEDAEVTVEANPEHAAASTLAAAVEAGATRVSFGAQSFVPAVLATLERGHGPDAIARAVTTARAVGVPSVSVDLIYGTPGERAEDWARTLAEVLALDVDHVSAYALSIHENTPFGRAVASGRMVRPADDDLRERFELLRASLVARGFDHYEVSNLARGADQRSRHNVLYWRHGDYLGVGVGAHAHRSGCRGWTTRSLERYLDGIEAGGSGALGGGVDEADAGASPVPSVLAGKELLDDEARALERLLLGLRLREGIHPSDLPPLAPEALADAVAVGLVEVSCGRVRATPDGWFLLDEAVRRLGP